MFKSPKIARNNTTVKVFVNNVYRFANTMYLETGQRCCDH